MEQGETGDDAARLQPGLRPEATDASRGTLQRPWLDEVPGVRRRFLWDRERCVVDAGEFHLGRDRTARSGYVLAG